MKKRNEIIGLPVKDFKVKKVLAYGYEEEINKCVTWHKKAFFAAIPFDGSELVRFENWWGCEDYVGETYSLADDALTKSLDEIDGYGGCTKTLLKFVYMWSEKHNMFIVDMSSRATDLESFHEDICKDVMAGLETMFREE